jgi:hypothetical protein
MWPERDLVRTDNMNNILNDNDVTSTTYIYLSAKYKLPILSLQSLD